MYIKQKVKLKILFSVNGEDKVMDTVLFAPRSVEKLDNTESSVLYRCETRYILNTMYAEFDFFDKAVFNTMYSRLYKKCKVGVTDGERVWRIHLDNGYIKSETPEDVDYRYKLIGIYNSVKSRSFDNKDYCLVVESENKTTLDSNAVFEDEYLKIAHCSADDNSIVIKDKDNGEVYMTLPSEQTGYKITLFVDDDYMDEYHGEKEDSVYSGIQYDVKRLLIERFAYVYEVVGDLIMANSAIVRYNSDLPLELKANYINEFVEMVDYITERASVTKMPDIVLKTLAVSSKPKAKDLIKKVWVQRMEGKLDSDITNFQEWQLELMLSGCSSHLQTLILAITNIFR